ncbi:MAG TPA: histidinol dehydrogenase [Acidobacteria bacterium]|nr:histidinol dehydrogenase [Acidobacteriota bacterium]
MSAPLLPRCAPEAVVARRPAPVDAEALALAAPIVEQVLREGLDALRRHAERFDELCDGRLLLERSDLLAALEAIEPARRSLLERSARRIETFARRQRSWIRAGELNFAGGAAGQQIAPVQRAGGYAPGGRYPLPSSVLMTAVTARAAGVDEVWIASPRPTPLVLAAAAIAGADGLLAAGGAHAVAALAGGAGKLPACDVVVGPGNRFVTAAKKIVSGMVGIDTLAGPSELTVLADADARPRWVAADLLAQAEHDPLARPVLIALDAGLEAAVQRELLEQVTTLPTAAVARRALGGGLSVIAGDLEQAVALCDRLAPEHLALHLEDAETVAPRLAHYGALFIGGGAAEVLGDYGAGPNHTLPTGGAARYTGGLSVLDFLRVRTWLRIDDPGAAREILADAEALAEAEGLSAHARSARLRREGSGGPRPR